MTTAPSSVGHAPEQGAQTERWPWLGLVLRIIGLGITAFYVYSSLQFARTEFQMDLQVFQDAGWAALRGDDLYSEDFPTRSGFRFIYPPIAALLFIPLTLTGQVVTQLIWTTTIIGCVWLILYAAVRSTALRYPVITSLALLGIALRFEPIFSNIYFGQINIFLATLIALDLFGLTPKPLRGIGLGLAAAIKITPVAMGLVFLIRKDWASIVRAIATVLVTIIIGALWRPQETWFFFTTEFFATDRAGDPDFFRNQALTGLLAREFFSDFESRAFDIAWLIGALIIVAASWFVAYRATRRGEHLAAVFAVGLAAMLAVPYAVTHHWVWIILLLPLLCAPGYARWRIPLGIATVVFIIGPNFLGDQEHYSVDPTWDWVVSAQSISALLVLGFLTVVYLTTRRQLPAKTAVAAG